MWEWPRLPGKIDGKSGIEPLYLLDANVLIQAHEDYYPIDRIPQFWDWLDNQCWLGVVKMPYEIFEEMTSSKGLLKDWITDPNIKSNILLDEQVDRAILNAVLERGYGPDLNDIELEQVGRDPFLVAYGLNGEGRVIVTKEVSKISQKRGNTKLPDACNTMGVKWMNDFEVYRTLDFRTWKEWMPFSGR